MRVLYIGNGLTHYYNLVLSRLNLQPGVELTVIAPSAVGKSVGAGVHQTTAGINFKVIPLPEVRRLRLFMTFKGLAGVIRTLQPDVIVATEEYLRAFLFDLPVVAAMRSSGVGLVLKSIPFQYLTREQAIAALDAPTGLTSLPDPLRRLLHATGLARSAKRLVLHINERALNLPDAHVNYVEAFEYWQSYGVSRDKVFVTRNSPDTDTIVATRARIDHLEPLLPTNGRRLLHVGRLVAWKRVDMLLRAFSRVRQVFADAELLVVGGGPEEANLKALAAELQLGSAVTFLGGIYDPELLGQYFRSCSLYVLAGMGGLSINEAMCYGLPVVCSICDGTEKILVREGVNGRYFIDADEDDLTAKITGLLQSPDELRRMGQRSEAIIANDVNIHTVIGGYMDALRFVCQSRGKFAAVREMAC